MWLATAKSSNFGRKASIAKNGLVAVAIDKGKGSQHAIRWTIENLVSRGQTIVLIHVLHRSASSPGAAAHSYAADDPYACTVVHNQSLDKQTKDLFITFRCFCTCKDIHCIDIVLEDSDVPRAITDYVAHCAIENLVLGSAHHTFIKRFKIADIPASISKMAPDFCTVYVISKTKISSVKNAVRQAPFTSPLKAQIQKMEDLANSNNSNASSSPPPMHTWSIKGGERTLQKTAVDDRDLVKSLFTKGREHPGKIFGDLSAMDTDISFVSSDRPSTDSISTDHLSSVLFDSNTDSSRTPRMSVSSESSFGSILSSNKGSELSSFTDISSSSLESDDGESEMRRLKLELQRTMEMYSTACKEALTAKQKAVELHKWRIEEEKRLEEGNAQPAPMAMSSLRCRRYTLDEIEQATEHFSESRKIGEGGYGPVYKCYLDHTRTAVKVLHPDAAQGREQFEREVEVLSCLRHPHMVLLLGVCPELGCLVYEYMANGSLEDCLMRRGDSCALSWQLRFRIAAEITTCLHFLHQTKPEPLVHRDLKPANILLDQNYVSKISDVGLARLVPPSVVDEVTQCCMTSAAGTFCYIDPEYQQTGMLGVKSDVYALGVVFLQILTAKPPMGLTYNVANAVEEEKFTEMLDPAVPDWPVEEALSFAKMALHCTELRRKDRPNLGTDVLPYLARLRDLGEENMQFLVSSSIPTLIPKETKTVPENSDPKCVASADSPLKRTQEAAE